MTDPEQRPERLTCMTVWGGNTPTSQALEAPGLNIWIYSRPAGTGDSGGDVYYISSCASGRVTRILLADVSGHGPRVSATANVLENSMRDNVNRIKQKDVVASINRQFLEEDTQDAFATAVVATYFSPTRKVSLSNAGHPPPLLFRSADKRWVPFDPDHHGEAVEPNFPLGVQSEARFAESQLRLEPGDKLLCYTDAFVEARDTRGELLTIGGLANLLNDLNELETSTLVPRLLGEVRKRCGDSVRRDDSTLIILEGSNSRVRMRESLMAPVRLLGRIAGLKRVRTRKPQTD